MSLPFTPYGTSAHREEVDEITTSAGDGAWFRDDRNSKKSFSDCVGAKNREKTGEKMLTAERRVHGKSSAKKCWLRPTLMRAVW